MKILHVSTATSWRGGEQQVGYLADELNKLHVDQIVLCTDNSGLSAYCSEKKIHNITFKKKAALSFHLARLVKRICTEKNISLIHAHDSHAHTAAVIASTFFGSKTPIVVNRRVFVPVSKSVFSKYKYNHPYIKKIICISQTVKDITAPTIKDKNKFSIVHSGIDLNKFNLAEKKSKLHDEYKIPAGVLLVGNVSALSVVKDYFTFVDVAEKVLVKINNVVFMIIGEGNERSAIENYIRKKQLENKIILTGFRDDIPDILPELDIFLMTSLSEGLGTTILDAFAAKVPVVSTNAGGLAELVLHEKTGLTATVKDSEKLSEHVIRLIGDVSLRKTLAESAFKFVQQFSKENMARKTFDVYRSITD